jgi:hypothetical protein
MIETVAPRPRAVGSDFAALTRRITESGLLERLPAHHAVRIGVVATMLGGAGPSFTR